ncbi:MAG: hypothetical protein ACHP6I_03370 [Rickettsiales bacterium]
MKEVVRQHLAERVRSSESDFVFLRDKIALGKIDNEGYVATAKDGTAIYMIKAAIGVQNIHINHNCMYLVDDEIAPLPGYNFHRNNENFKAIAFASEFFSSSIISRIIFGRAPTIALVEGNNEQEKKRVVAMLESEFPSIIYSPDEVSAQGDNGSKVYHVLRSKYLDGFQTAVQFTGGKEGSTRFGPNRWRLEAVEGFEKLIAAALFAGDYDINAGNVGIMREDGKNVFAKVDHGWGATRFFTDSNKLLLSVRSSLSNYGYKGIRDFNLIKFKQAVDEIIKISDDEIEKIICSRLYELKSTGFSIENLTFRYWKNDTLHHFEDSPPAELQFADYDDLEKFLLESYTAQRSTFVNLSQTLDILCKLDNMPDGWIANAWIYEVVNRRPSERNPGEIFKGKGLIEWVLQKKKTIEGKQPIIWALDNDFYVDLRWISEVEKIPVRQWIDRQFVGDINVNFQRKCNLWIYCQDVALRRQIAIKAIKEGAKFYGIAAITYLEKNHCVSQLYADDALLHELQKDQPAKPLVQNLLNSGAIPTETALQLMIAKKIDVLIEGSAPQYCLQALRLDARAGSTSANSENSAIAVRDRISLNIRKLIDFSPSVNGKPVVEFMAQEYPDLKIRGLSISDGLSLEFSRWIPSAKTILSEAETKQAFNLCQAGIKISKSKLDAITAAMQKEQVGDKRSFATREDDKKRHCTQEDVERE